jgi:hypothetical protein
VLVNDKQLHVEAGQTVVSHGVDRDLTVDELNGHQQTRAQAEPTPLASS